VFVLSKKVYFCPINYLTKYLVMNKQRTLVILLLLFLGFNIMAQRTTNIPFLESFAVQKENEWKESSKRAATWAKANNISVRQENEDGSIIQLIDVIDGKPVYIVTNNVGAAITTRAFELWEGGSTGLNLTGEGYDRLGEWDGGAVRLTHQEFNNLGTPRVFQTDGATSLSDHATHVAGTLVGGGVNPNAKGMSYMGTLKAHDWNNAEGEMALAASLGLEISNHSYGYITGWHSSSGNWTWYGDNNISDQEDFRFGFYGSRSRDWDQIAYNAPYYLIVKSSGNDRGQGPSNAGTGNLAPVDGGALGFDCIGDGGTAKNMMSVGAVAQVSEYTGPSSVIMSSFSSWGPVDDGRIKPDIVAKGVGTFSAGSTNNTHYSTKSGTSMSSPNTAGTLALLQQHYQQTHNGTSMLSSTLRALAIHTADEAGPSEGPDYMFGWGLLNAERASQIISEDDVIQNAIDEPTLTNDSTFTRELTAQGGIPLRVTIAWIDPAGTVLAPALNDRTPSLVHDLDLKIIGPDGEFYFPYKLDPDNPTTPATNDSKNYVDNVEMVYIENPMQGTYTIQVDHEGVLNSDQVFSLIISGINEYQGLPFCSSGLIEPIANSSNNPLSLTVRWNPSPFSVSYKVYFGTNGDGVENPTNILDGVSMVDNFFDTELEPGNAYYLRVVPVNEFGENEECIEIWSFHSLNVVNEFPYIIDLEEVTTPGLPDSWQQLNLTNAKWATTTHASFQGNQALACYNPSGLIQTNFNNYLISPPVMLESGKEYYINFFYRALATGSEEKLSLYWGNTADTADLNNQLISLSGFTLADGWMEAEAILVPENDIYGYLAWKAESSPGFGILLDNIKVYDWGAVGVNELKNSHVKAHYANGQMTLNLPAGIMNAELNIFAADGRIVFSDRLKGEILYSKALALPSGIYVVTLEGDGISERIKIVVK
jgi:hypothetical protein